MSKSTKFALVFTALAFACRWVGFASTNYVAQAPVVLSLGAPVGPAHITTSGCWSTNTITSGTDYVECSDDNAPGWGPARIVAPDPSYSTLSGSQWINCPAQSFDGATFQTTFELPPNFTNASLFLQVYADNGVGVYLNGVNFGQQPLCDIHANYQYPPTQYTTSSPFFPGTNTLTFYNVDCGFASGVDFIAAVSYQPGLPVVQWSIKDASGESKPTTTTEGHMIISADGMSQAIATIINTTDTPTLSIIGSDLGCTLSNSASGWVFTASTNNGTVQVGVALSSGNSGCYTTNFFFDLAACQSCQSGGSCDVQAGLGGPDPYGSADVDIRFSLGPSRLDVGQAFLQIKRPLEVGTPQFIHSDFIRPEIQNITNANGFLRQVGALDRIVDIVTNSSLSYTLSFYDPTNVAAFTNGLYQFSGSPFRTVSIVMSNTFDHLNVTDSLDPYPMDYYFVTSPWPEGPGFVLSGSSGWQLVKGAGLSSETWISAWGLGTAYVSTKHIFQNAQGVVQSTTIQTFSTPNQMTQEIFGSDAQTNNYTYNTNGIFDTVTRYDCSWDKYVYDSLGRQISHYSPFTNSTPTTNSAVCRLTSSTYTNSVVSGSGDDPTLEPFMPRQVIDYVLGAEVSRRYTVVQTGMRIDIQCVNPGAAWNDSSNLFTTNYFQTDFVYFGQPSQIIRPDGTMQLFSYDVQPLPNSNWPILKKTTVWSGAQSGYTNVVDGTRQETWVDARGHTVLEMQTDIASSIVVSSNFFAYDNGGHLLSTSSLDGTSVSNTYDCCHLTSSTDRDGTATSYIYDALHRQVATTRAGITVSNILDSAGNVLGTVRYGTDNSAMTTSQASFDDGGQQLSSTDALNNTTSYTNYPDGRNEYIRQTTYPDLTTQVQTYASDRSLLKTTGTAVHGIRYEYGVQSDGGFQRRYTREIKLDSNGNDTSEWTKTLTDGAGRAYKLLYSDSNFSQSYFNNGGQLIKQRDPDAVFTLTGFNSRGQPEYTVLDLNTNGIIDFAGADRITRTVSDVVNNATLGANVTRTRVYAWSVNSSAVSNLLSSAETSADGLHTWQTSFRDASTPVTNRTDALYAGGGFRFQTNTAPDGSYTVSEYQYGRLASVVRHDSVNSQISAVSYAYDVHGRQAAFTDARNGATIYGYNNADLVTAVTGPSPGGGQNAQTTATFYNSRLQVSSVVAPDNASTTYEYSPVNRI